MTARGLAALGLTISVLACGGARTPQAGPPAATPVPPTSAGGWVALAGSPLSPGTGRHDDVFFLDASNGWLINTRGEVHRTRDAGAKWEMLSRLDGIFLRCVGFASLTRG